MSKRKKRKKKDDKRWDWYVDYSGVDMKAGAKVEVANNTFPPLSENDIRELWNRPMRPPQPAILSPQQHKDYVEIMSQSSETQQLREAFNKLVKVVDMQQDTIESLRAELAEIKGLLKATLKISRKGSGF